MRIQLYKALSGRSPVEDFIRGLSIKDQGRFSDVFDGIRKYGFDCPRVKFRHLAGKLWEIKFKGEGGGFRIAYFLVEKDRMVWLHVFRKTTQRTPRNDLELAEKRMAEVLS